MGDIVLTQKSDYPWNGRITLTIEKLKAPRHHAFVIGLRCPEWVDKAGSGQRFQALRFTVNGQEVPVNEEHGYLVVNREWKQGDVISYELPMDTRIIEANPLVEESRGQVAVMRGPILYCLESNDLGDIDIDNIILPVDAQFRTVETTIAGSRMMALETDAFVRAGDNAFQRRSSEIAGNVPLYHPVTTKKEKKTIRLIPYYAWGNRGKSEMTVWMPAGY